MGRRIAAIAIAWLVWTALWIGMNSTAQAVFPEVVDPTRPLTHTGALFGFIVWSVIASITAGYVCAVIASTSPMKAVWTLAIIQLLVGIGFELSYWSMLPVWYHLVFLALLIPATVMGGKLRTGGAPTT
jgi:hypothetical protein